MCAGIFICGLLVVTRGHLRQQTAKVGDEQVRTNRASGVAVSLVAKRNTTPAAAPDPLHSGGIKPTWNVSLNTTLPSISGQVDYLEPALNVNFNTSASSVLDPILLPGTDTHKIRSYITQSYPCKPNEWKDGLGRVVTHTKTMVDIAVSQGLGVICKPDEWKTGNYPHNTGNLGFLFGCISEKKAVGRFVSEANVRGLRWEKVKPKLRSGVSLKKEDDAHDEALYELDVPIRDDRVYNLVGDTCPVNTGKWGQSWRFYRSQYHLVRTMDPGRLQASRGFNFVILVRRGDIKNRRTSHGNFVGGGTYGYAPNTYVDSVEVLQRINGVMNHSDIRISVIAEESADTEDAKALQGNFTALQRKYAEHISDTRFYFGSQETDETNATQRIIRDLDMISLADVLILSGGYFSSLGAALQMNGTAFCITQHRLDLLDLPNHREVGSR